MAKKVRRVRKPARDKTKTSQTTAVADTNGPSKSKTKSSKSSSRAENTAEEFRVDYAYVLKDLRRVFILAGILFTLLIALNLLLQ